MYPKQQSSLPIKPSCLAISFTVLLWFMLLFVPAAFAEQANIDTDAAGVLLDAHPGYTISAQTQYGDTIAAVLSKDTLHILCVAEKQNGSWTVTIDNPTALKQSETIPVLLLDSDTVLCWYYYENNDLFEYWAEKEGDIWGTVSLLWNQDYYNDLTVETRITYRQSSLGMVIYKTKQYFDENGDFLHETTDIPIPGESLAPYADLENFDIEKFPCNFEYTHDWTNAFIRQSVAEQLMPEYSYIGGLISEDSFQFLMQKPNGDKVFIGVAYDEAEGWILTESTPLPEDVEYGHDNFSGCLYLPDKLLISFKLFADGTWGVDYLYAVPEESDEREMFSLGQNWIAKSRITPETRYIGTHPWSDITTIDWSTLPMHLTDAVQMLDQSSWAVVNNPDPEDRLHLRVDPDRSSESLGKYYNGTAVQVLEDGETWVKVSVYGVEGYMMKKYLAFGEDMNDVDSAMLYYTTRSYTAEMYEHPEDAEPSATITANTKDLCIIGIIGDEWYHVWCIETGQSGYIRQSDLWPGNG